jgi:alanyl aminopeptidase
VKGSGACPVVGNEDAAGYYRVAWSAKDLQSLVGQFARLSPSTRIAVLADAWAQTRAGKLDAGVLVRTVLPAVDSERDRHVIERLVGILYDLSEAVDDATLPAFATYVRARLAPHLRRLHGRTRSTDDDRLLRRTLTYAAIDLGEDGALLRSVAADGATFSRDTKSFDADYGQAAVELGARLAAPSELQRALADAKTPQDHALALRAASDVVDPTSVRAQLEWMLSPAVKLQDVRGILWPMAQRRTSRAQVLAFVRDHWDALRHKLPGPLGRGLVGMAGYACTQPDLDGARAFYGSRVGDLEGAERPLAQALESAQLCVALRSKVTPELKKALRF